MLKSSHAKSCPICGEDSYENVGLYEGRTHPFNNRECRLLRCPVCDLVYMNPLPSERELNEFYKCYWNSETSVQSSSSDSLLGYKAQNKARLDFTLGKVGSLDGKSILDYGAGHGFFEEALRSKQVKDYRYYAVDTDVQMVQNLKEKGINAATAMNAFENTQYDIVVAFHVLEHLTDPLKLIEKLIKLTKHDGFLFLEMPNKDHIWKTIFEPHVLFFSQNAMTSLLNHSFIEDFDIVSCGRSLKILAKERNFVKRQKHRVGRVLRSLGLRRSSANGKGSISEDSARSMYEMDRYGEERQWLRVTARKHNRERNHE